MKSVSKFLFVVFILSASLANASISKDSLFTKKTDSTFVVSGRPDLTGNGLTTTNNLFTEGLLPSSDPIDSVQYYINKIRGLSEKIRETQNYISNLNDASLFTLPAGPLGLFFFTRIMPTFNQLCS